MGLGHLGPDVLVDLWSLLAHLVHLLAQPIEALLGLLPLVGRQGDHFGEVSADGEVPIGSEYVPLGTLMEAKEGLERSECGGEGAHCADDDPQRLVDILLGERGEQACATTLEYPPDSVHIESYPLPAQLRSAPTKVERELELPPWHQEHDQGSEGACVGFMALWILNMEESKQDGTEFDPATR